MSEEQKAIERLGEMTIDYRLNSEDLTLTFMYCDEKAKDKIKELQERINKAIEYIEWQKNNPQYDNVWRKYECESLVYILRGED